MKKLIWEDGFIDRLVDQIYKTFNMHKSKVSTENKEKHDYVTNVDKALEQAIIDLIKDNFPEHQVFGEESLPDEIDFSLATWLIDPLDGTSNFIFNLPFYSCSIAYVENNEVTMGLVIDLINHEVFKAYLGEGSYLNEKKLQVSEYSSDFIGLSSKFLEQAAIQKPSVISELRNYGKFRILGSQALHLCYVAAGRFKACINYEAKVWDDIAGALIVEEAGGKYCSKAGFSTTKINVIKTNNNLFSLAESSAKLDLIILMEQVKLK